MIKFTKLLLFVSLGFVFTFGLPAFASFGGGITYHGRILKPDGTAETDSSVSFLVQIYSPGGEKCLFYETTIVKDLSASSGAFSITIDDSLIRTDGSGYTLDQIFANRTSGTYSFAAGKCDSGTTYNPGASDSRKMIVQFQDSTMGSPETLPAQSIVYAPTAIEAYEVGGFPSASLLRVENGSGPQSVSSLTPTQAANLVSLANGSSTQYVQSGTNGAALPSFATDPSSPSAGDVWYDSTDKIVKYFDGTSPQPISSLPSVGTAGTYTKVTTDAQGRVTAGAQITGDDITSGTIQGSTAINSTGNITLTGGATVSSTNITSTSDSTNNLLIWDGTSHKVTVTAPVGLAADYALTLPTGEPASSGMALVSTTAGVLSWASVGTGNGDFKADGSVAMTGNFDGGTKNLTNIGTNITAAAGVTLSAGGTNNSIGLTPSGTGIVVSASPLAITPASLPVSPVAGELAFDSAASNALKFYNGSSWQTVGTGTGNGDFKADGSVAMTGDFDGGTKNLTNIGTSITAAADVNIGAGGTNKGITLTPTGTGVVTSSSPLVVTPASLPVTPVAGELAFDSAASNALKFYNGSAWQTVGTGTGNGDFKADGSVAMTGAFNAGSQNLTAIGTNITASADLTIGAGGTNKGITLSPTGSGVVTSTTPITITPTSLPAAPAAGAIAIDSSASNTLKYYNGSSWQTVGTGTGNGDFKADGSVAMTGDFDAGTKNLTNIGTSITAAANVTLAAGGTNKGITLTPTGTGVVTSSSPLVVTPASLPVTPVAGELAFDSAASNALKFYNGSAWQTVGTGTGNGDFMKDGSVAMTGNFNAGGNEVLGNTTASANLTLESTSDSTKGYVNIQPNGGNVGIGTTTPVQLLDVNGPIHILPAALPGSPTAGVLAFDSGASNALKFYNGSSWQTVGTGTGSGDFKADGSVAMTGNFDAGTKNLTNIGTNITAAADVTIGAGGTNKGITLTPTGTGVVTSSSPLVVTPASLPVTPVAGELAFDSAASNALKFYNGSAWQTVGTGTGDFKADGSVAMTGNFDAGTKNLTNIGSSITAAADVTLAAGGTNKGITLTPTGTGIVTSSSPIAITPASLPAAPVAGELAFDSAASNALKFYNGTAWQTVGTGTGNGDFKADGSVTMTGDFDAGTKNLTNIGTNITAAADVTIGAGGTNKGITLTPTGTGVVTSSSPLVVTPASLPVTPVAGELAFDSAASNALKFYNGSSWQTVGTGTGDFKADGSVAMTGNFDAGTKNLTNIGTSITAAADVTLAAGGTNKGITLTPTGTGIVTSSSPIAITPASLPAAPIAGELAFDSAASNALKFYNGTAWQTVGTGTGNGDFMKDGSVAMTGNFDAGTKNLTNIGTNITATADVTIGAGGTNKGITLTPTGTGVVTSSSPLVVTPASLPVTPVAGELAFDSAASNALKFYNGSAWQTVGTGTGNGDFKADGSVAMTGDFNAGGQTIKGLGDGTNTNPAIRFANGTNFGFNYNQSNVSLDMIANGVAQFSLIDGSLVGSGGNGSPLINRETGSNTVPSYAFKGPTGWQDTGMYAPAIGTIGFSISGTEGARITSTGVGIGTTSPTRLLQVAGAMNMTPLGSAPTSPTAGDMYFDSTASNALKYYNGTAWQTVGTGTGSGDFMKDGSVAMTGNIQLNGHYLSGDGGNEGVFVDSSGYVGIGTSTPSPNRLEVNGDAMIDGELTTNGTSSVGFVEGIAVGNSSTAAADNGSAIGFYGNSGTPMSRIFSGWNAAANTNSYFGVSTRTSGSLTEKLRVTSGGNVGIGTTTPSQLLDVNGPIHILPAALPGTPTAGVLAFDSGASNALKFYNGSAWQTVGTGTGSGDFMKDGSVAMTGNFNAGGNKVLGNTTASANLTLESTSDSTKGYVNIQPNGGNVGIGTTAPSMMLNLLNGDILLDETLNNGRGIYIKRNSVNIGAVSNANTRLTVTAQNNKDVMISNTAGAGIMLKDSGNVGIGTLTPGQLLDVNGPIHIAPAALPGTPAAGVLAFDSGASNALKFYNGTAWQTVGTGTGSGDFMKDGSVAMTGNFNAGGNKVLGNTTASANLTLESTSDSTKGYVNLQPNGGNVGIGTTSPGKVLDVTGNSTTVYQTVRMTNAATTGNAPASFDVTNGLGTTGYYAVYGNTVYVGASSNNDFNLVSNNSTRMVIAAAGNVGVGTTNPSQLLDVNGPIHILPATLPGSPTAGVLAFDSGASNALKFYNGSAWQTVGTGTGSGDFMKDGSVAMTGNFNAGGNKVLGNTTASANLTLESTSDSTKGNVILQPTAGNVGIGTTTTTASLTIRQRSNSGGMSILGTTGVNSGNADFNLITSSANGQWDIGASNTAGNFAIWDTLNSKGPLTIEPNAGSNILYLKTGGNIGIGTNSADPLGLTGSGYGRVVDITSATAGQRPVLELWSNVLPSSNQINGQISFLSGSSPSSSPGAAILSANNGTTANTGNLQFYTSSTSGSSGERMRIDYTGNVGIGTTSPSYKLDVNAGSVSADTWPIHAVSTASGTAGTYIVSDNASTTNHQVGFGLASQGAGKWFLINSTGNNTVDNFAIYSAALTKFVFEIEPNGNVGIGTTSPAQALDVNGNVQAVNYFYSSDRRLKKDIRPVEGLKLVDQLQGVRFNWRKDGKAEVGLIAQDVEKVLPELVSTNPTNGMKAVEYGNLVAPVIEATKELHRQCDMSQKQIAELSQRVDKIERQLATKQTDDSARDQKIKELESEVKALKNENQQLKRTVQEIHDMLKVHGK